MQPFRTILFATDFSDNSKQVFEAACSLARKSHEARRSARGRLQPDFRPTGLPRTAECSVRCRPARRSRTAIGDAKIG